MPAAPTPLPPATPVTGLPDLQQLFSLHGQVALVTGAQRGLGWEIARHLAAAGAHVVLNDLRDAGIAERAQDLRKAGLRASHHAFDVTDGTAVRAALDHLVAELGRVDVVVNNAGIQNREPFLEFSEAEWQALQDTHVRGAFHVSQAAARHMVARGYGRILMLGSLAVTAKRAPLSAYAAAKGALTSLARELAWELGPKGITCNVIAPGYIATEFTRALTEDAAFTGWVQQRVPLGRWGTPQDIAPAALFLVSPAGAYINGACLTVDGGVLCGL